MNPEGVVGEQFDPLHGSVTPEALPQRADVGLGIAVARDEYIAQPERFSVGFEPGGRAERLGVLAAGEGAVAFRIGLLHVQQHQVDQPQQLFDGGVPHPAVRVDANVDAGLFQRADQRDELRGLESGFAAREGHAAAFAVKRFLVDGHAQNLRGVGRPALPGLDRIGVGAVEAAEIAALQENDEPESRPVESSHRFVGVNAYHLRKR